MKCVMLVVLFIISCVFKELQGQCTTPVGERGQCKIIVDCEPLLAVLKKRNKDSQDVELLNRSQCGFVGTTPKVCCPEQTINQVTPSTQNDECYTPDLNKGQCVDVYSCPHLAKLLEDPNSNQNLAYLQRFSCTGLSRYSVCCALSTFRSGTVPRRDCKTSVSALPPDSSSECCGLDANTGNKIFGGTEAALDQFPWLTIIEYDRDPPTDLLCGGSLISGRYILTAGHCVIGPVLRGSTPVRIRLGEYNKDHEGPDCKLADSGGEDCTDGAIRITIEKVIPHPEFKPNSAYLGNDIALIRMNRLAPYTEFIRPICLPQVDITMTADSAYNVTVSGWGTVNTTVRASAVKLYVVLPYVPLNKCQELYNRLPGTITLSRRQMCAGGEEGKDSCKGDSGGPLMHDNGSRHVIVGISSFGHRQCGFKDVPGVYTNVYQYQDWIRSNILT